jgi:Putative DNA-binding domain
MQTNALSLATLQREMLSAILAFKPLQAQHPLRVEINAGKLTPVRRLDIYQHNAKTTLTNALASLYPVVSNIVGAPFFLALAAEYIAATPSRSGDLHDYGAGVADFIAGYAPLDELPYLADVAKLEWRWHVAFHAADATAFDVTRLQAIPAEDVGALQFRLSPAVSLITSAYPLLQIWLFNTQNVHSDYDAASIDSPIDWEIEAAYFVVSRIDNTVEIRELSHAAYTFLAALRAKSSLANALDTALRLDAQFDLQQTLSQFIEWQLLVDSEIALPQ